MADSILEAVNIHGRSGDQVRVLWTVDATLLPGLPILPEEVPSQGIRPLGRASYLLSATHLRLHKRG